MGIYPYFMTGYLMNKSKKKNKSIIFTKCPLYVEHYIRFRPVNLWDTWKVLEFQDWEEKTNMVILVRDKIAGVGGN